MSIHMYTNNVENYPPPPHPSPPLSHPWDCNFFQGCPRQRNSTVHSYTCLYYINLRLLMCEHSLSSPELGKGANNFRGQALPVARGDNTLWGNKETRRWISLNGCLKVAQHNSIIWHHLCGKEDKQETVTIQSIGEWYEINDERFSFFTTALDKNLPCSKVIFLPSKVDKEENLSSSQEQLKISTLTYLAVVWQIMWSCSGNVHSPLDISNDVARVSELPWQLWGNLYMHHSNLLRTW